MSPARVRSVRLRRPIVIDWDPIVSGSVMWQQTFAIVYLFLPAATQTDRNVIMRPTTSSVPNVGAAMTVPTKRISLTLAAVKSIRDVLDSAPDVVQKQTETFANKAFTSDVLTNFER